MRLPTRATPSVRGGHITPAMQPPPGFTSNFVDPETRSYLVKTAAIISPIISGLFLTLRLYTRVFITRTLGWDDYTCVMAMLCAIGFSGTQWNLAHNGLGTHLWDVPYETYHGAFIKVSTLILFEVVQAKPMAADPSRRFLAVLDADVRRQDIHLATLFSHL